MAARSDTEAKAKELMQQAKAAENKFSWFGATNKFEEAGELYSKAANQYKVAKKMKESGDAYMLAADSYMKGKCGHDGATNYVNASKAYRKDSPKDAVKALEMAIKYYCDQGRFGVAANHQQEIGEIHEKNEDIDQAIIAYEVAADMFEGENTVSSANKCNLKVGDMYAQQEDFGKAVKVYEKMAEAALGNNLLVWGVKDYYFKAGLCTLATGDFGLTRNKVEEYINNDSKFASSREGKFLVVLVKSALDSDLKAFTNAIVEFDAITPLDAWKTSVLLKAKNFVKEQGDGVL